ncbi:hypothetical protein JYG34_08800 [Pseudomonas entomophila]|uniref:hypothetical protein n=1 Tax=Pseudomonas entomophila TaxID=312306 RepID=UPI001BCA781B|nr:hypothetical protein [Pseudomonas entomophila]QVM93098.1 hypothetical protein JYG34_08800 [Pseudomonas entomophila]
MSLAPRNKTHPPRPTTAHAHFGTCNDAHPPMFSVHAGIDGEDALVCAVAALRAAYETNAMALERAGEPLRSLLVATENSLEKGLALSSAVLDGIERG